MTKLRILARAGLGSAPPPGAFPGAARAASDQEVDPAGRAVAIVVAAAAAGGTADTVAG